MFNFNLSVKIYRSIACFHLNENIDTFFKGFCVFLPYVFCRTTKI
ncbi:hypothetical protein BACCOP_02679 [Phocaeicola coprocola DSM 17136]|uniref:Uncharacterized protein n=1 Tax=Phocaeicola coprocola DSM 17136 TaxID=470145 RepID=B3JL98_9BACT|nr:hypothetical protein BACCOP_02679 [Phocaeicola coprocola DSM 17136]